MNRRSIAASIFAATVVVACGSNDKDATPVGGTRNGGNAGQTASGGPPTGAGGAATGGSGGVSSTSTGASGTGGDGDASFEVGSGGRSIDDAGSVLSDAT